MYTPRIAMVVFSHYPLDVRVRRAAEALAEAGMSVDVICLRDNVEPRKERVNGVSVYRIKIKRKRGNALRYFWEYGYFMTSAFVKLSILQLIKGYNIVHVHNLPDILVLSALFPKICKAHVILDIHDVMPEVFIRKYGIPAGHNLVKTLQYLEKLSIKFADHIIVASPFFRETLIRRSCSPGKCTTILNLPDPKYFKARKVHGRGNSDGFKIIYPGTLGEIHGVDIAIKAIGRVVKQTRIPIQFYIYGEGAELEKNKLMTLTKNLDLQDVVHFNPKVPAGKLARIYQSMDIGIVPKRDGVHAKDAMSTKLFEFAAVGLPTIVSRTKADSLYFDESMVTFFEPENESELADCIVRLYRNPELRKSLCQQAALVYRKINWKTESKKLYAVYDRMLLHHYVFNDTVCIKYMPHGKIRLK